VRTSRGADPVEDIRTTAEAFLTSSRALMGVSVRSVAAASVPLTVPQHRLLVVVASGGPRRIGALADDLGVNQSNASRLVDRMSRLGLVRRTKDAGDARAAVIELTPSGREVLEQVNDHRLHAVLGVLREMPPDARRQAAEAMRQFNEAAHEVDATWWPT
jgi:DNA-binding MarR family transcriptional regulator